MKTTELQQLSDSIEMGIHSGRSWVSTMEQVVKNHPRVTLRDFCTRCLHQYRELGKERGLSNLIDTYSSFEVKVFLQVLNFTDQSNLESHLILRRYSAILYQLEILNKKRKSLEAMPKLQAMTSALCSLFLVFGLPFLFPETSISFFSQRRFDLMAFGSFGIIVGVLFVWLILWFPTRRQRESIQIIFFLHFVGLLMSSGLDARSSWKKALGYCELSEGRLRKWNFDSRKMMSFEAHLVKLSEVEKYPWAGFLSGFSWAIKTGARAGSFLGSAAEKQVERFFLEWEEASKVASFLALLPLYLFSLPSVLFLLIGPVLWGLKL